MKRLIATLLFSTLLATTPAFAGSGHSHAHGPISKEKVIYKAERQLKRLVKRGKIDQSWTGKKATSAKQKTFGSKKEWVITFKNPELADKSKQTLYLFYKLDGHYLAKNYTGK